MDTDKLIHKELSYKIRGICIDTYKYLGYGFREKTYEKAIREKLKNVNMLFKEQLYAPIRVEKMRLSSQYLDFLIEDKIILEIKVGVYIKQIYFDQVEEYLKNNKKDLGILALFSSSGVKFSRVLNHDNIKSNSIVS